MLRLPAFTYAAPDSVEGVLAALAERPGRARVIAGGTDLLPNLKHGIEEADVVVSLRHVAELRGVTELRGADAAAVGLPDGTLRLGAMTTLQDVARHPLVRGRYASLAQAAGLVAGPHHRRMGTIGGNVCLNTRCVYINQTYFWRSSLGFCLKKDGDLCHVVKGGKRCVAAASNDTAPPLMTHGARLLLARRDGPAGATVDATRDAIGTAARAGAPGAAHHRQLPLADFFVKDGVHNKTLAADELLLAVLVPPPAPGLRSAYTKLRPRNSIDFPRLGVAVAYELRDAQGRGVAAGRSAVTSDAGTADLPPGLTVHELRIVVTALAATPQPLRDVRELAEGKAPGEELWEAIAAAAYKQCHPLTNIDGDATYRREMVPVFVKRALRAAGGVA